MIFQEGLNFDDSFEFIPTQLTVAPGGVTAFATADGEMVNAPLVGVVIGAVIARGLWREGNKIPLCSSIGGDWGLVNLGATGGRLTRHWRGSHGASCAAPVGQRR